MHDSNCEKCDTDNLSQSKYCSHCGIELKNKTSAINENLTQPLKENRNSFRKLFFTVMGLVVGYMLV